MRKSFEPGFEKKYFKASGKFNTKNARWPDWAAVQAAMAQYGNLDKFAGLFYNMKTQAEKNGKNIKILCDGTKILKVMGL